MSKRRLNVTAEVAQRLPAAHIAQLQAVVDDPDNRCGLCGQLITGPVAEAVLLCDGDYTAARLAHPDCGRSGIYDAPGLRVAEAERLTDGLDITTSLARRPGPAPQAIVFIELLDNISLTPPGGDPVDVEDPLTLYAVHLGLEPITGTLMQITPAPTTTSRLSLEDGQLIHVHPHGRDVVWDEAGDPLTTWTQAAVEDHATALIITARGLGLSQQPPTIAQALTSQPAWGAQVTVDGLPRRRPWRLSGRRDR